MARDDQKPRRGVRPPKPGPTETLDVPLGAAPQRWNDVGDTGKHLIMSLPPERPESSDMMRWIASVEGRLVDRQKRPSDPVPGHLRKTRELIEFAKYIGALLIGLVTIGWMGRGYIASFQTEDEAREAQAGIEQSISAVGDRVEANDGAIENLRIRSVRIEIEQRNTNDQLGVLLDLQRASNRAERRRAARNASEVEARVQRRERVMEDPRALRQAAERLARDPFSGLEGL